MLFLLVELIYCCDIKASLMTTYTPCNFSPSTSLIGEGGLSWDELLFLLDVN